MKKLALVASAALVASVMAGVVLLRAQGGATPAKAAGGATISIGTVSASSGQVRVPITVSGSSIDPYGGIQATLLWHPTTFSYAGVDKTGSVIPSPFCADAPTTSTTGSHPAGPTGVSTGEDVACVTMLGTTSATGLAMTLLLTPLGGCSALHLLTYYAPDNDPNGSDTVDPLGNLQSNTYGTIDVMADPGGLPCTSPPTATRTITPTPTNTITPTVTVTPIGTATPAPPGTIAMFNPSICAAVAGVSYAPGCAVDQYGLEFGGWGGDSQLLEAADSLGNHDGVIQASDFAAVDGYTARQIHQRGGEMNPSFSRMAVVAFVQGDGPVTFHTTAGFFSESGTDTWVCDGDPARADPDPDCDGTPSPPSTLSQFREDGVVVAYLSCTLATCPTRGPATLTVAQGSNAFETTFTVVGEAVSVELDAPNPTFVAGGAGTDLSPYLILHCPADLLSGQPNDPTMADVVVRVFDADGTAITGAWLTWYTSDALHVALAARYGPTLALGARGVESPNAVCGTIITQSGPVGATARLVRTVGNQPYDPMAAPDIDPGTLWSTNLPSASTTLTAIAAPDSDGDGYPDALELSLGQAPYSYCSAMRADVNWDGKVALADLIMVAGWYGKTIPPAPVRFDQNADGKITLADLIVMSGMYSQNMSACLDSDGDGYSNARELALGKNPLAYCNIMRADVNMDGKVTQDDLDLAKGWYGQPLPAWYVRYDQNGDGRIGLGDLVIMASLLGDSVSACP